MYTFTNQQNQEILYIPTNSVSDTIYYISENDETNQRIIVDAPNYTSNWTPNTWIVSKVERVNVKGRTKITLYQTTFNQHTDYIEKADDGTIIGLWANYYESNIAPDDTDEPKLQLNAELTTTTSTIKLGGSYKTITCNIYDDKTNDVTNNYQDANFAWSCDINDADYTENVTWKENTFNTIKLKFPSDRTQFGNTLNVKCTITKDKTEIIATIQLVITE